MIFNKRSQAALEFLMTYGWAILVVLVVIGALSYFGVLNPSILLPEKCQLEIGLDCTDWKISDSGDSILLKLTNGRGSDIFVQNISISQKQTGDPIMTGTCINVTPTRLNNGYSQTFSMTGCSIDSTTRKIRADINISFYKADGDGNYTHVMHGELLATVEP